MPLRKQQLSEGHICGKLPLPIFGDVRQYIKLYTPTVKVQLLMLHHRRNKAFYSAAQLGMLNHKMYRGCLPFGNHRPLSFVNMYLQIPKNMRRCFFQCIIRM